MNISYLFLFSTLLFWLQFSLKYLSKLYTMDEPNHRKHHTKSISQIGGISFGSIFLFLCFYIDIIPFWFVLGSSLSIILGVIDDRYNIKLYIKMIVQLM